MLPAAPPEALWKALEAPKTTGFKFHNFFHNRKSLYMRVLREPNSTPPTRNLLRQIKLIRRHKAGQT